MALTQRARAWLSQCTGIPVRLIETHPLTGATSSSVYAVRQAGSRDGRQFVLRVFVNRAWLEEEPDLVEHEAAALKEAQKAGIKGRLILIRSSSIVTTTP